LLLHFTLSDFIHPHKEKFTAPNLLITVPHVSTYIPDNESALGRNGIIKNTKWISGYDLAEGADLLYHDGQYTSKEYDKKKVGDIPALTTPCWWRY
jgi:hypothetical protein